MIFEEDLDLDFLDSPNKDFLEKHSEIKSFIPDIYKQNRDSQPFNSSKFLAVFLTGILIGMIVFYVPFFIFENGIVDQKGMVKYY